MYVAVTVVESSFELGQSNRDCSQGSGIRGMFKTVFVADKSVGEDIRDDRTVSERPLKLSTRPNGSGCKHRPNRYWKCAHMYRSNTSDQEIFGLHIPP